MISIPMLIMIIANKLYFYVVFGEPQRDEMGTAQMFSPRERAWGPV
ncbi:hypothetical protein KJ865_02465 [Myxococcota bacterium]|nr:hypothetical protein [Myxococcota bacterium]